MLIICLGLTACGGSNEDTSSATIANRAESLERAADATTDQLISEIKASAAEDAQASTDQSVQVDKSANQAAP